MKQLLWLVLLSVVGLCRGLPAATQASSNNPAMGRLFFTSEQRNALEHQRQLNILKNQALQGETLSLNGTLIASGGRKIYWVNGRPMNSSDDAGGVKVSSHPNVPGKATITIGNSQINELRVGESVNRITREKDTGVAAALLQIKSRH